MEQTVLLTAEVFCSLLQTMLASPEMLAASLAQRKSWIGDFLRQCGMNETILGASFAILVDMIADWIGDQVSNIRKSLEDWWWDRFKEDWVWGTFTYPIPMPWVGSGSGGSL